MDLVLSTYGVALRRDNEAFIVQTKDGKQRIPASSIKSIQVGKGIQLTSDAIMLAIEQEVEILFMNKVGNPCGRVWSPKYGSISTIRKGQLAFTQSPDAVRWIKGVISAKIANQQALMLMVNGDTEEERQLVEKNIARLEEYRVKVDGLSGENVSDIAPILRGWEGQASRIYFATMNLALPEQFRFEERSQHPARDITNAFLNYGYGMLYGKIEGELIKAGIDPYIGVLHRDEYNRPVLVYDVIERYRVWVDYVVYTLLAQNAISDEYYSMREDGSCWLEGLGRRVLIQSINDYLEEKIEHKGEMRARNTLIRDYTIDLAQQLKKY